MIKDLVEHLKRFRNVSLDLNQNNFDNIGILPELNTYEILQELEILNNYFLSICKLDKYLDKNYIQNKIDIIMEAKVEKNKNLLNYSDFINIPLNTVFQIKYEKPTPFRILRRWEKLKNGMVKGFYYNIVSLDGEFYKDLDITDRLSYLIFPDFNAEEMLRQVREQQEMK